MTSRMEKPKHARTHAATRFNMPDGRVERVWEDPFLNPAFTWR